MATFNGKTYTEEDYCNFLDLTEMFAVCASGALVDDCIESLPDWLVELAESGDASEFVESASQEFPDVE